MPSKFDKESVNLKQAIVIAADEASNALKASQDTLKTAIEQFGNMQKITSKLALTGKDLSGVDKSRLETMQKLIESNLSKVAQLNKDVTAAFRQNAISDLEKIKQEAHKFSEPSTTPTRRK